MHLAAFATHRFKYQIKTSQLGHNLFQLLLSGRRFRTTYVNTTAQNSFPPHMSSAESVTVSTNPQHQTSTYFYHRPYFYSYNMSSCFCYCQYNIAARNCQLFLFYYTVYTYKFHSSSFCLTCILYNKFLSRSDI